MIEDVGQINICSDIKIMLVRYQQFENLQAVSRIAFILFCNATVLISLYRYNEGILNLNILHTLKRIKIVISTC
jgi:hypothetical protein